MAQNIVRLDKGEEGESEVTLLKKRRQGWEGGGRNRKRHEDRRWIRRRWRKLARGRG